ncbi:MAG: MBL fold metallo-hydrolase [Alphaproteobacteria bacterium RIFCSPHIGHO2_12_FULL_63_12]|nr:MAG: MBL fold metallo-hydrolase [Alphaproteobacteria bacterium RIFCSPHIGHO2_12_FULL_63_12]
MPFVKEIDFSYGRADRLSPLIRRVICNNPGPFTYTGSGTYLVGRDGGEIAVIDPGPANEAHLDALVRAIGGARVSHVLITHTHSDHCGGARAFAGRVGAPIFGAGAHPVADKKLDAPALDEGADYAFAPDKILRDGDVITGDGWTIGAVATPGHLSNHLCFALSGEGALFTGDHIMGWATTVIAPPDGDMADYFDSLDKLLARDDVIYYPTHGAPIENPKPFVRAIRTHRRIRDGQILDQLKKGRTRIKEITEIIYADIDKRLHGAAALNVYAHLIRLVKTGAVACDGAPGMKSAYRPNE